jgi:hypothetical protein
LTIGRSRGVEPASDALRFWITEDPPRSIAGPERNVLERQSYLTSTPKRTTVVVARAPWAVDSRVLVVGAAPDKVDTVAVAGVAGPQDEEREVA